MQQEEKLTQFFLKYSGGGRRMLTGQQIQQLEVLLRGQ